MCGITLVSSISGDVIPITIASLEQLQNRGYDSVGVAYHPQQETSNIEIKKHASTRDEDCFDFLTNEYSTNQYSSSCAIGHTRWATHGARNTTNAHPHYSYDRNIVLVHNGIIENYGELREFLQLNNIYSYSETDSEVIANMIAYQLTMTKELDKAILETCKKLSGTYALGIISPLYPNIIYAIRNGSPLVYGQNSEYKICTSEIAGFNGLVNNYVTLDNGVLYRIDDKNSNIVICGTISENSKINDNLQSTSKQIEHDTVGKGDYSHYTESEIFNQPESILRAINYGGRIAEDQIKLGGLTSLAQNYPNRLDIDHVIILGCGTSMHAGMIGANYIMNNCNFSSVNYYDASEFSKKNISAQGQTLAILCSQSGETRDLCEKIDMLRTSNCITLGVINQVDSQIANVVDFGVYLNAGREVGVASTKSFTSMVIVLSLISLFFSEYFNKINPIRRTNIIKNLRNLSPSIMRQLKSSVLNDKIQSIAEYITENNNQSLFILGKSNYFAVAREISLKIKEICYIHAEGFSGSALKHGPFALLDEQSIVVLIITSDTEQVMMNCFEEIFARGANIIVFTNTETIEERVIARSPTVRCIRIDTLDYYGEINITVALQCLSYRLSLLKGINPDKPRNLAKVVTVQ
tara:strand:- start:3254 stop:5167 length:1914 start_codon:yes stop_codon:yes gene_type:complete